MKILTFQKNDVIFRQGDFADTMYKIVKGSVRIVSDLGEAGEKEIALLNAGDYFGEMGLAECFPRSASAVVCSETAEVTEFDFFDFQRLFKEDPDSVLAILRQLAARLKETNGDYLEAVEVLQKAKGEQDVNEETRTVLQRLHDFYLSILGK